MEHAALAYIAGRVLETSDCARASLLANIIMNRVAECSNGNCDYPFLIPDTTIDITIRTSSRPPHRGLATTTSTELDGHDGMTVECIYMAALQELAQESGWRPDGLSRIKISIYGQEWHARTAAELRQPLPVRVILALRDAQNALTAHII